MENRPSTSEDLPHTLESLIQGLTDRQREILQWVQNGKSNKEIAHQLGISEGTVKQHLVTIFRHLKVRNRTMAANLGLLSQQHTEQVATDGHFSSSAEGETPFESGEAMHYASAMQPISIVVTRLAVSEAMVHRLGSDQFGQLNRTLQQVCSEAVHRFHGMMQAMPGGFLLLFGVPHMREDNPERAACCAFWVQQAMADHPVARLVGERALVRLCILSGEVVTAVDGGKISLHGDILSHPCLLTPNACGNDLQPHLSNNTRKMLHTFIARYGPPTSFFPEGDALLQAVGPMTSEPVDTLPFFGRESEWETLQTLAAAAKAGRSQNVVIVGEAGFGKTRLVRELRAALTVDARWLWLEGGGRTLAGATPWYPVATLLAQLSGCPPDGSRGAKVTQIQRWLLAHYPAHAESGRRLVALLTGAGQSKHAGEGMIADMAALLRAVLTVGRRPTVLFLDNLQWADPHTLALFSHLARRCQGTHLWLIGATRRFWLRVVPSESMLSILSLHRLTQEDTLQLLRACHPDGSGDESLMRRMAQWSSGVPLFAAELGKQMATIPPGSDPNLLTLFPRTLLGLILERLDAAHVDWRVVRAIAAHGRISLARLLALGIYPETVTEAAVDHLAKIGLLGESPSRRERELFFNNEIVRAAVWLTLLKGDRRTLG